MKKLVYLLGTLLLTAALAACSSDYDDPPEQPNSHQDEVPVDSVDITPTEGQDSTLQETRLSSPRLTHRKSWKADT